MKLNTKKISVLIGTKTGRYTYVVSLSEEEREYIADLIYQLHNGKIEVFKNKIDSIKWNV